MRKLITPALATVSICLIAWSCNFSKGIKTDLVTGITTSYNGFAIEQISVVDGDDNQLSKSEVALDSKFSIVYEGIENYTLKDGKAFPGLSLHVTDAAGNDILNEVDLFASSVDGYSPTDASVLRGSVTVGDPMKAGETYHCKMRVFDKQNPESEIVSELDFTVN